MKYYILYMDNTNKYFKIWYLINIQKEIKKSFFLFFFLLQLTSIFHVWLNRCISHSQRSEWRTKFPWYQNKWSGLLSRVLKIEMSGVSSHVMLLVPAASSITKAEGWQSTLLTPALLKWLKCGNTMLNFLVCSLLNLNNCSDDPI